MAIVYWTDGAADGNLATTSNYSTGALPSAADTLIFDRGTHDILGGSALSAIALTAVVFTEGFKANKVGSAGNPALFRTTDFTFASKTVGLAVVQGSTTFTNVYIRHLPGIFNIAASTPDITKLYLGAGPGVVEVATSVSVTDFKTGGMGCVMYPDATTPPNMTAVIGRGANVESQRLIATAVVDGLLNVTNSGSLTHSAPASATCRIMHGGRVNFASLGTFTRVERLPGSKLTFENARRDVTIGQDIQYIGSSIEQPIGITVSLSSAQITIGQGSYTT
jgi:hypothetical protein